MSPETAAKLIPDWNATMTGTVRTKELAVLFESGDTFLVKPADRDGPYNRLHEISRDKVHAIVWLD